MNASIGIGSVRLQLFAPGRGHSEGRFPALPSDDHKTEKPGVSLILVDHGRPAFAVNNYWASFPKPVGGLHCLLNLKAAYYVHYAPTDGRRKA